MSAAPEAAAQPLTLQDAMQTAAEQNPRSIIADERVRQSMEQLNQARSYFFPTVDGISSWSRQTRNLESFGITAGAGSPAAAASSSPVVGPFNVFDARIRVTQKLFDLGMLRRFQAARASEEWTRLESARISEDVIALAAILYIEASRAREAVDLSSAMLRLSRKRYSLSEERLRVGSGTPLELRQARSQLALSRALHRAALTRAAARLLDLKSALAISAEQPLRLTSSRTAPAAESSASSTAELLTAAEHHPDVAAADKRAQVQALVRDARKADSFPILSGAADYGLNGKDPGDSENTYAFGAEVSWPLFDAGRRGAQTAEADSQAREALIQADDTLRRSKARAITANRAVRDVRAMLAAKDEAVLYWREHLSSVDEQVRDGSSSELNRLEVRVELLRSEDERAEALATLDSSVIERAHALGELRSLINP
jgi:outer membrane protein